MNEKIHLADSALNRLMNFMDALDAPPVPPTGPALDAALAAPVGDVPPVDGMEAALVAKGLGLGG